MCWVEFVGYVGNVFGGYFVYSTSDMLGLVGGITSAMNALRNVGEAGFS